MTYRKFRADRLFDGERFREGEVLITDEKERVEAIIPESEAGDDTELVSGILCPGLILSLIHI